MQSQSSVDPDAQLKAMHGKLAAFAWVASSLILYGISPTAHLFSIQAAAFVLLGTLAAALVFGNAGYWLQKAVVHVFVGTLSGVRASVAARLIHGLGIVMTVAELAAVFLTARWIFGLANGALDA